MDGETDEAFRARAERAGLVAQALIEGCLANRQIREMINNGEITESSVRTSPTVRVEYEQAIAIGGIGETLAATASKHWGDGPWILPLEPDDAFFPDRITYVYRAQSLYNRRFEQRKRLKELLGRAHRKLVGEAKWQTKQAFLAGLAENQSQAIRRILGVDGGEFWRACRGKAFLDLPPRLMQLELPFSDE